MTSHFKDRLGSDVQVRLAYKIPGDSDWLMGVWYTRCVCVCVSGDLNPPPPHTHTHTLRYGM